METLTFFDLPDNWALLYAQRLALKAEKPLSICFSLPFSYQDATLRAYNFIIEGLKEVEKVDKNFFMNCNTMKLFIFIIGISFFEN